MNKNPVNNINTANLGFPNNKTPNLVTTNLNSRN